MSALLLFSNFDYKYPLVMLARFLLSSLFRFHLAKSCVFRDTKNSDNQLL